MKNTGASLYEEGKRLPPPTPFSPKRKAAVSVTPPNNGVPVMLHAAEPRPETEKAGAGDRDPTGPTGPYPPEAQQGLCRAPKRGDRSSAAPRRARGRGWRRRRARPSPRGTRRPSTLPLRRSSSVPASRGHGRDGALQGLQYAWQWQAGASRDGAGTLLARIAVRCRPCAWFWKPQGCQNDQASHASC